MIIRVACRFNIFFQGQKKPVRPVMLFTWIFNPVKGYLSMAILIQVASFGGKGLNLKCNNLRNL
jgi:hypothetical protein